MTEREDTSTHDRDQVDSGKSDEEMSPEERRREAARLTDEIRRPCPGWDSTEEIRRWRDRRYSG